MELIKKIISFFLDIIEIFVMAMAMFVVCYLFFFQPHQVKGSSMEPNFHNEEYLLTDKISYHLHPPQRGDVIIFRAPKNRELDYIKRVIGLPGEKIKISNGEIFINGQKLKETYLPPDVSTQGGTFLEENREFLIPQDEYFVCGDNRTYSSDSREWGTVNKEDIIGKAWLRYWPLKNFGILPQVQY